MSSTQTNGKPEHSKSPQSSASLAQRHSAVSPLIQSITGDGSEPSTGPERSDPELVLQQPTVQELTEQQLPPQQAPQQKPHQTLNQQGASASAQPEGADSQSEQLSLSEQYGSAGLLAELNSLVETQQFQLEQHRDYVLRSRAEQGQQIENWQLRCAALEEQLAAARDRTALLEQKHLTSQSQVLPLEARLDAAQQLAERLQTEILDRRQQQIVLEDQLALAETTLREQQEITSAQARGIVSMQAELSQVQTELAALETRLSRQDYLRQQLKADGKRDRQSRSQARDRQLQLEQETTQMTGQLLRLNEELRRAQRQSTQWRRQAQTQAEQLRDISRWAAQAESVPPELMALLTALPRPLDAIDASSDDDRSDIALLEDSANIDLAPRVSQANPSSPPEYLTAEHRLSLPTDSRSENLLPAASPVIEADTPASNLNSENEDQNSAGPHSSALNLPNLPQGTV